MTSDLGATRGAALFSLLTSFAFASDDNANAQVEPAGDLEPNSVLNNSRPPRPPLADVASIPTDLERNAELYALAADADAALLESWFDELGAMPTQPHTDDVFRVLYVRYVSLDPPGAVSHALHNHVKPFVLAAVFRAWAHRDLNAAVTAAVELPKGARSAAAWAILQLDLPDEDRSEIAERLGVEPAIAEVQATQPSVHMPEYHAALDHLAAIADTDEQWNMLTRIATTWAATDARGALAQIAAWNGSANLERGLRREIMESWADADPRGATDWVLVNAPDSSGQLAYLAYRALALVDPDDAVALVDAIPAGPTRRQAAGAVFSALLDHDLDRAVGAFDALHPERRHQVIAAGDMVRALLYDRSEQTVDWMLGLEPDLRGEVILWTDSWIYRHDPAMLKSLVDSIPDESVRIASVRRSVIWGWETARDPDEALRWAASLGSEEEHAPLVASVFGAWSDRDPAAAQKALLRYKPGPARDRAFQVLIGASLKAFDGDTADGYFDAIDAPDARREAAQELLRYYTETDPDARKAARYRDTALGTIGARTSDP